MIRFVNAKINLGLNVVRRRPDGYHDLETIFYPVGIHNGTPCNPSPFCDILELTQSESLTSQLTVEDGDSSWRMEDNLVWKALEAFAAASHIDVPVCIHLLKRLPWQAGLGAGSADAAFALNMLNEFFDSPLSADKLLKLSAGIGSDTPFFMLNVPSHATGRGEILTPVTPLLKGYWCLILKPEATMSTAEAFASITPTLRQVNLLSIYNSGPESWRDNMINDFEAAFQRLHPECSEIPEYLYSEGAVYASLSGSGSAFYGIFSDYDMAYQAYMNTEFKLTGLPYRALCLL